MADSIALGYGDIIMYVAKSATWNTSASGIGSADIMFRLDNNSQYNIPLSGIEIRFWTAEPYDSNRYRLDFKNAYSICYDSTDTQVGIIPSNTWVCTTKEYKVNNRNVVGPSVEAYNYCSIVGNHQLYIPSGGSIGGVGVNDSIHFEYKLSNSGAFRRQSNWYSDEPEFIDQWAPAVNYALYYNGSIVYGHEPIYDNSIVQILYGHTIAQDEPSSAFNNISLSTAGINNEARRALFGVNFSAYSGFDIRRALMFLKVSSDYNYGSNADIDLCLSTSSFNSSTPWSSSPSYSSVIDTSYSAYNSHLQLPFYHIFDITDIANQNINSTIYTVLKYKDENANIKRAFFDNPYVIVDAYKLSANAITTDMATFDTTYIHVDTDSYITDSYITDSHIRSLATDMYLYTEGGWSGSIRTNTQIYSEMYNSMITDMVVGVNNNVRKLSTNQVVASNKVKIISFDEFIIETKKRSIYTDLHTTYSPSRIIKTNTNITGVETHNIYTDSMIVGPVTITVPPRAKKDRNYGSRPLFARDVGWNYDEVTDINSVRQSISSIVLTPKRTKLRDPSYGVSVYDEVFGLATNMYLNRLLNTMVSEIEAIDNRVSILRDESTISYSQSSRQLTVKLRWKLSIGGVVQTSTFIIDK